MSETTPQKVLIQLRELLKRHFNKGELKALCFELDIEYDDLPGEGRAAKVQELVTYADRHGKLKQLLFSCQTKRPQADWSFSSKKIFIAYKRANQRDSHIATLLLDFLKREGHDVFIDRTLRTGTKWLDEIDRQIQSADFLIVLLSPESADSEMVQSEVKRAYDYREQQGWPQTLPIRIKFEGLLPYTIDAFLNKYQYITWDDEADTERLKQGILAAINGHLSNQPPIQSSLKCAVIDVAEDGRPTANGGSLHPPLPEFDPRLLDVPGGTVKLRDNLYVKRHVDAVLENQMILSGSITTIRGSRQTGKSSLLVRGIQYGRDNNNAIINLDLQRVSRDHLKTLDDFLRYLATFIIRRLRLDTGEIDAAWDDPLGPQDKISYLMEEYILNESKPAIILAMDEVDRLLETSYHSDFFGLIRSWYNNSAYNPLWEKLHIVMAISTEPYLLIADANQSPFNVGQKLNLEDFTLSQTQMLNERHGAPVRSQDFSQFMFLLNGHPYLTRKALYTLVNENLKWGGFVAQAATDHGPFSDHLRRQLWLLRNEPGLQKALKQIIRHGNCDNEEARFRLGRAGLVKGSGNKYACRCDLYRQYFEDKLG